MVEEPTGWLNPPKTKSDLERQIAELRAERDEARARVVAAWNAFAGHVADDYAETADVALVAGGDLDEQIRSLTEQRDAAEAREARLSEALRNVVDLVDRDVIRVRPSDRDEFLSTLANWNAALSGSGAGGWRETPTAKTLDDWHEDDGFVVWWTRQHDRWLGEPSYIGSPLCSDWPGYHTHWTPHPAFPAAPTGEAS